MDAGYAQDQAAGQPLTEHARGKNLRVKPEGWQQDAAFLVKINRTICEPWPSMRAGLIACAVASLVLDFAVSTRSGTASTLETTAGKTLACRYLDRSGYNKFSPRKLSGQLPLPFALQINDRLRKIDFASSETKAAFPFFLSGDELRFDLKEGRETERFRVNTTTLQFQTLVDTRRSLVRLSGVCETQSV